jgi:putative variant cofactor biosynthesis B12-binding/radical SAM domain protein 1
MKILLVQSYLRGSFHPVFPLGLSYLAASLSAHEVQVLDLNLHEETDRALENALKDFNPDIVGISLRNVDNVIRMNMISFYEDYTATVRHIKKIAPTVILIAGGPGFSMFAADIMKRNPELDFGVFQEGEESLPELLYNLDCPQDVKGIFYRDNEEIVFSGPRVLPDIKSLSPPQRDIFDMSKYTDIPKNCTDSFYIFSVGVQSKRGCILNCTYCNYPFLSGRKLRLRSTINVVDEIQELKEKYYIDNFSFVDTVFNVPLEHAEQICKEIIRRALRVRWSAYFDIRFINEEFLVLARQAGCEIFEFSPDGVSTEALKGLNKGITKSDINRTISIFRKNNKLKNSKVVFYFFVNPPGETFYGLLQTLFYVIKANLLLRGRGEASVGWIRVLPDTGIYKTAIEKGILNSDTSLLHNDYTELKYLFYSDPPLNRLDFIVRKLVRIFRI